MSLEGDPGWAVAADGGHLLVTAGADAVWLVEDVPSSVADLVARFWTASPPRPDELDEASRPVVEHLAGLGALRPRGLAAGGPAGPLGVLEVGDPVPEFRQVLASRAGELGTPPGPGSLTVVVRTNARLVELTGAAVVLAAADAPHLLVDLALAHTVVLGPHVVPGDTACLGCLAGRVGLRWGDPVPPARPGALGDAALAALLVARWLRHRGEPGSSLVNATVALDLAGLSATREPLWRAPGCPVCGEWTSGGRVPLPWTREPAGR